MTTTRETTLDQDRIEALEHENARLRDKIEEIREVHDEIVKAWEIVKDRYNALAERCKAMGIKP